jgi:spore coat protein U-like protein
MIIVWQKPTKTELKKSIKDCIKQATQFFKDNPSRKVCRVGWYADTVSIRRNHIKEDVEKYAKTVETK